MLQWRVTCSNPTKLLEKKIVASSVPSDFQCDTTEDGLSSTSISSSDDSFEELPDIQNTISIDPVILDDFGPWEASDLHQSIPQCHNLAASETACPYPEPPPVFHGLPEGHRDHSEGADSQDGSTQPCQHHQLHPSQHSTDIDASYSNGARENRHVGGQSKPSKRKTQQSHRRDCKQLRAPSTSPSRENYYPTYSATVGARCAPQMRRNFLPVD